MKKVLIALMAVLCLIGLTSCDFLMNLPASDETVAKFAREWDGSDHLYDQCISYKIPADTAVAGHLVVNHYTTDDVWFKFEVVLEGNAKTISFNGGDLRYKCTITMDGGRISGIRINGSPITEDQYHDWYRIWEDVNWTINSLVAHYGIEL